MINNKKVLAVILARKGSQGLPGKNTLLLRGEPLFIWSLQAANQSKYVDFVATSSNDENVQEHWNDFRSFFSYASKGKIESIYIDRPEDLCGPDIKNEPVLIHAYSYTKHQYNFDAEIIVCLQPTSPVRYNGLLDSCLEQMIEHKANSLLTVTEHYPFIWHQYGDHAICPNNYFIDRPMRQEIDPDEMYLFDNGNIYITETNILLKENNRLGGKITTYPTNNFKSLQIDNKNDFTLIEKVCEIIGPPV